MCMYLHTYGEAFLTNIKQCINSVMGTVHRESNSLVIEKGFVKAA